MPEGQLRVIFPVKPFGAVADTLTVAVVFPIRTSRLGLDVDILKTASPVPEKATDWGLPVALSLIDKEPVRAPLTVGENVTLTLQLCPTLRTSRNELQVFVCEKSPLALIPVMLRVDVPVLVIVTVCAELTSPTVTSPKERLDGETVTAVAAVTPAPVTLIVCGLLAALSAMLNVPDSEPSAPGVNVMSI